MQGRTILKYYTINGAGVKLSNGYISLEDARQLVFEHWFENGAKL
jgi:hypothetical protein